MCGIEHFGPLLTMVMAASALNRVAMLFVEGKPLSVLQASALDCMAMLLYQEIELFLLALRSPHQTNRV